MPSEIANALFFTYIATEYILVADSSSSQLNRNVLKQLSKSRTSRIAFTVVVLMNLFERLHFSYRGAEMAATNAMEHFFHLPRIAFASSAYISVLYFDCKRTAGSALCVADYLLRVILAFLRVAPIYPFLAVIISTLFMVVISVFEALHIDIEILNWPIYYGVLYGPFSAVYWSVKSRVVKEFRYALPTTSSTTTTTETSGNHSSGYLAFLRRRVNIPSDAEF